MDTTSMTRHYTAWLVNTTSHLDQPNMDLTILLDEPTHGRDDDDNEIISGWSSTGDPVFYAITTVDAANGDVADAMTEAENLLHAAGWHTAGDWGVTNDCYTITVVRESDATMDTAADIAQTACDIQAGLDDRDIRALRHGRIVSQALQTAEKISFLSRTEREENIGGTIAVLMSLEAAIKGLIFPHDPIPGQTRDLALVRSIRSLIRVEDERAFEAGWREARLQREIAGYRTAGIDLWPGDERASARIMARDLIVSAERDVTASQQDYERVHGQRAVAGPVTYSIMGPAEVRLARSNVLCAAGHADALREAAQEAGLIAEGELEPERRAL